MKPPSPLTDIYWIDPKTDQGDFIHRLHQLRDDYGRVSVMHACDIHFPYENKPALEVFYQLFDHVQPQICAVGSDAGDFSIISSFAQDADEDDGEDVLDAFDAKWTPHIHRLKESNPDVLLFFLLGNHEKRIYDFILRQAPQIRNTVWRRFQSIVRCDGRVHWLGDTPSARTGPLLIQHGNRTSLNPAKSLLEDLTYQVSTMAGHVHKLSYWGKRGEDFSTSAVTSGCLCNYPHYMKRERMTVKWQLGTAIADVDLRGREVRFDNLEFQVEPDRVWVRYERKNFEAENYQPSQFLTYEEYLRTQVKAETKP